MRAERTFKKADTKKKSYWHNNILYYFFELDRAVAQRIANNVFSRPSGILMYVKCAVCVLGGAGQHFCIFI
jgi:hypothetical protein